MGKRKAKGTFTTTNSMQLPKHFFFLLSRQIHTCGTPTLAAPEGEQTSRKLQNKRGNIHVNLPACATCTCSGKAMVWRIQKKIEDNFY